MKKLVIIIAAITALASCQKKECHPVVQANVADQLTGEVTQVISGTYLGYLPYGSYYLTSDKETIKKQTEWDTPVPHVNNVIDMTITKEMRCD